MSSVPSPTTPASLIRANAVAIPLASESVDLIVTSPPYFALRSYQDGGEHYDGQIGSEATPQAFLEALWAVTAECARVLKPSGSLWVNLGDKYAGSGGHNNAGLSGPTVPPPPGVTVGANGHGARKVNGGVEDRRAAQREATRRQSPDAYNKASIGGARPKSLMGLPWRYAIGCIDQLDLILRAEVIWSKPNGLPESVTDRVRRSHEQWFHFTREGRYFSGIDEIREGYADDKDHGQPIPYGDDASTRHGRDGSTLRLAGSNPLGKLPGSVWTIPSEPLILPDWARERYDLTDHFAAFPQEWPRRLILGWSPSGVCVACGQGRTPVVVKDAPELHEWAQTQQRERSVQSGGVGKVTLGIPAADRHTSIAGYACACAMPEAPTCPAVVLDPFAGTGTTVMVAQALGRHGVGLDLSSDYLRLARWRICESGHVSKTRRRTNLERQEQLQI